MIKEFISPRTGKKIIVQMDDISPVEKEIKAVLCKYAKEEKRSGNN